MKPIEEDNCIQGINYNHENFNTMITEGNGEKPGISIPVFTPKNKMKFPKECISSLSSTNTESNVGSTVSNKISSSNINSIVEFDAKL